jgi:hypothetical protein
MSNSYWLIALGLMAVGWFLIGWYVQAWIARGRIAELHEDESFRDDSICKKEEFKECIETQLTQDRQILKEISDKAIEYAGGGAGYFGTEEFPSPYPKAPVKVLPPGALPGFNNLTSKESV